MGIAARMQSVVQMIYPPRCLACGGMVDSDFGLCGTCWRDTPFIAGLTCDKCGTPLPGASDHDELCDECLTTARPWSKGRAALVYRGRGRKLVLALKHGDRHDIARPAGLWMARQIAPILPKNPLIAPIPLHLSRHLSRRYNQSALLARALAERVQAEFCPDLLERPRATPSLDGKNRDARFATLAGQIRPNPARASLLQNRAVVLVDDVLTSGATLAAGAEACLASGAREVFVSVLARVTKDP